MPANLCEGEPAMAAGSCKSIFVPRLNRRQRMVIVLVSTVVLLVGILAGGVLTGEEKLATCLTARNLPPSLEHPFGTDWLGRDMLVRAVKGLTFSLGVGALAAAASVVIALLLGLSAAIGGRFLDTLVTWLVDFFLGLPHMVFLLLIAFVLGGGVKGVAVGVAVTHWPSLARVVRAEVLQLSTSDYVAVSRRLGRSRWWIARRHFLPHLWPLLFLGFVLLVPHAILHEASITFLGFGLSPHQPAVGIILSESMKYLSTGMWWLAVFPGLALLLVVGSIDLVGDLLRTLLDPRTAHE